MSTYDKASLIIPVAPYIQEGEESEYGKIFSLKPADSNNIPTGVGDFQVGRNCEATYRGKDGLIKTATFNTPRYEFPADGGCPYLLTEPESTNLISDSEGFGSIWVKTNIDVSNSSELAPDGTSTATKVIATNSGTQLRITCNVSASSTHTLSFYAKKGTSSDVTFRIHDLSNGSDIVSSTSYYDDLTDEWSRVTLSFLTPVGCSSVFVYLSSNNVGVGDFYLWGAQLEELPYATSYIPTDGATETRLKDEITDAGDSSTFNSSEGVLYAEIDFVNTHTSNRFLSLSDGSSNDRIALGVSANKSSLRVILTSSSSSEVSQDNIVIGDVNIFNKVAISYKQNDFKLFVNGVQVFLDDSCNMPTSINELSLTSGAGTSNFFGKTKDLRVYNTADTDLELRTLTGFQSFNEMANYSNYTII